MSKSKMITLPREVVYQAMKALENVRQYDKENLYGLDDDIAAIRAALEQPQPDPAPYLYYDPENGDTWTQEAINDGCCLPDGLIALYTNQKQAPLTVEQIDGIVNDLDPIFLDTPTGFEEEFCRAIERAHGIGGKE